MSLDLKRVLDLLDVVQKAAGHPNLAPLGVVALKELHTHSATAKKEHDEVLKKEAEEAAKVKAEADAKAKKLAEEEAKKAELTSRPQPKARPKSDFEKVEEHDEAENDPEDVTEPTEPVKRREVPAEVE